MLGPVGIEPARQIRQGGVGAAVEAARAWPVTHPARRPPVAEETIRTAPSPQVQVAVSQILMNAESLIASVMGVKANDVSISVNVGRYEF
jgi:hypothetical protein